MLLLVVLAACDISNPFANAPSPPALPGSAMDVNECQPFTSLPCPDQSIQGNQGTVVVPGSRHDQLVCGVSVEGAG